MSDVGLYKQLEGHDERHEKLRLPHGYMQFLLGVRDSVVYLVF